MSKIADRSFKGLHVERKNPEEKKHPSQKEGNVMVVTERNVVSAHPMTPVIQVAKIMKDNDFRRIPVTDAGTGRLEGLAVAMDILDFLGGGEKYNIIKKDYQGNFAAAVNCPIKKIMRPASYVESTASIEDVAKTMIEKHTSAIPIVEDKKDLKVVGIITETDILPQGEEFGVTVGEIMREEPIVATPGMMVSDLAKLMVRNGFRRLPVVQEDRLVGIVTVFDVLRFLGYGEFGSANAEEALSKRLDSIMQKEVCTLAPGDDISVALRLVREKGIGGFPVVDKNRLLGIVTTSDLIREIYG